MFERLTEPARQVVVLAQEEARTLKHHYLGTEHLLLGLLREKEGLAARVLNNLEITDERVRLQIIRVVGVGEEASPGHIQFTPRAKKMFELALREALSLGHNYIGTEHFLLGLIRVEGAVSSRILLDLEADSEKIRDEVIRMLAGSSGRRQQEPPLPQPSPNQLKAVVGKTLEQLIGAFTALGNQNIHPDAETLAEWEEMFETCRAWLDALKESAATQPDES